MLGFLVASTARRTASTLSNRSFQSRAGFSECLDFTERLD